jgi:hypothetical protein
MSKYMLLKNAYSRVYIAYKGLASILTYASIAIKRIFLFVFRIAIYIQCRIGYDMVSVFSGSQHWIKKCSKARYPLRVHVWELW